MPENNIIPEYLVEVEHLKEHRKYDEALEFIKSSLARYIDDYRLYEELADIYLYQGDIQKAQEAALYAQKLFPESTTGKYLLGYIAVVQGNFAQGVTLLEESNRLFQNNPEVLRNLGWAYAQLGDLKKGEVLLKRALNLAPEDTLIMEDLGVTLMHSGDIYGGIIWLKRAGREDRIEEFRKILGF